MNGIFKKLSLRLLASITVVSLIFFIPVVLLSILFFSKYMKGMEHQLEESADKAATLIVNAARYSMLKNDRPAIDKILLSLKDTPGVETIRIYSNKKIGFSSNPDEKNFEINESKYECQVCHSIKPLPDKIPEGNSIKIYKNDDGHRSLVKLEPIYNRRACSLTDCHKGMDEVKILGMLEIKMSLDYIDKDISKDKKNMAILFVPMAVITEIIVALLYYFFVHSRITSLMEGAKKVEDGELTYRVPVWGRDEIAAFTESFNTMVQTIQEQKQRSAILLANISKTINVLNDSTDNLHRVISDQSSSTTEQVATVKEVLISSEEMATTAKNISASTNSMKEIADGALKTCNKGKDYVHNTVAEMDRIGQSVQDVGKRILSLMEQSQQIGKVVNIIDEISTQSELLSLNASIEAAGAGDAGKRFGIVASEIRRLSKMAMESTKSIRGIIETIRESIAQTVLAGEEEGKVVHKGIESVRELTQYFEKILIDVESTKESTIDIASVTLQQLSASEQMVAAVRQVEDMASHVEHGIKEITVSTDDLKAISDQLKALADKNS